MNLAVVFLLFVLHHYTGSGRIKKLALFFAAVGGFLFFWSVSAYLGMNVLGRSSAAVVYLQSAAYIAAILGELVLTDIIVLSRPVSAAVRRTSLVFFLLLALAVFLAKGSSFILGFQRPFFYYLKWISASLILFIGSGLGAAFLFRKDVFGILVPRTFQRATGMGILLLPVLAGADLILLPLRFNGLSPLGRIYPLSVIGYLFYLSTLLFIILGLINKYRSAAYQVELLDRGILTPREREIVSLVLEGKSNKVIGDSLFIALPTVKNHLHNIYEKLSVSGRTELMGMFRPGKGH